MIFSISETLEKANEIAPSKFDGLKIWEKRHIQEWIRNHPQMLGEELLIVSVEFDKFEGSKDRIDLLALDHDGNLVVIELKRDAGAGHADLQALRYAAMVSSMTLKVLAGHFATYQRERCGDPAATTETAEKQLRDFITTAADYELSNRPRIILCSEGFSPEITTAVLWLNEANLDIRCVTITPYEVERKIVIVPRVIIPLAEAEDYQIAIKVKREEREKSILKTRLNVQTLVDRGLLRIDETIYLKRELPEGIQFRENDPTFEAIITGKSGKSDAVRWKRDGAEYAISSLAWLVFKELRPGKKEITFVSGKRHWVNSQGRSLAELEKEVSNGGDDLTS